jgi:hypothetical protein
VERDISVHRFSIISEFKQLTNVIHDGVQAFNWTSISAAGLALPGKY